MIKLFGKEEEEEASFIEIDTAGEEEKKIGIKIESLEDYRDIERIQNQVRNGFIVFLKIKKLKETDLGELKRSVEKLRKSSLAMGGEIVGVNENFLILTPRFARIHRGEPA